MASNEDQTAAIFMILLLRPDAVYILPDSNKLYKLNADHSDLEMLEIPSLWNMTDEEANEAIKKKLSE